MNPIQVLFRESNNLEWQRPLPTRSAYHDEAAPVSQRKNTEAFRLAFRALRTTGLALSLGLTALAAYQAAQGNMDNHNRAGGLPGAGEHREHLDATGERKVVFCHHCENEWWQDDHGLVCPRCDGEVTEVVRLRHNSSLIYIMLIMHRLNQTTILETFQRRIYHL